ncbi:SMI1/KNR4 family protein [Streptomyces sp. JNUCC 64]
MRPDLTQLRELIDATPGFVRWPGVPGEAVRAAESVLGPLPPSYRWWLTSGRGGRLPGLEMATTPPPPDGREAAWEEPDGEEYASLTASWRLRGDRLEFAAEPDGGDAFSFALGDRRAAGEDEAPVVCREGTSGEEYPFAESFAGFLTVRAARARGLGDGPHPVLARLWRWTPGVRFGNGVHVYGPHRFRERNEAFEVARRAPHWTLIGDDGRGGGLFARHHGRDRSRVVRRDLGAAGPDLAETGEPVTDDPLGWLRAGGVLPAGSARG